MFVSPMLLHQAEFPFNDNDWYSELKLDGIRFLYSTMCGLKLYTRHENEVTERFPELVTRQIPKGTILDGDENGKPDFEELMSRFHVSSPNRISTMSRIKPVTFCVFDVVYHDDKKVSNLPLSERKELLDNILPEDLPLINKVRSIQGNAETLYDLVKNQSLEGIVLKKKNSKYTVGKRSHDWLKVINYQYATIEIAGFRKSKFGWVLRFPDGKPAGIMELGVPFEARKAVYELSRMLESKEVDDYVYFQKTIRSVKCKVKYRTLSKAGYLRLPSFVEFAC